MVDDLLGLPTAELLPRAAATRDAATGTRITYSPKVFLPLTELCRDRCGYCTFAKAPARLDSPFLPPDEILRIARAGVAAGCHEALFTLGEAPEERYPAARTWLAERGWASTIDYLVAMCQLVLDETGLLPHANPGALAESELARLREVAPSQGMMIESLRSDLECHRGAPDKAPERRLATLESAGRLRIPYTTGILVGIGEDEADRLVALVAIGDSHRRHGHVQEVIVQGFLPKPGTAMHGWAAASEEIHLRAVALARLTLPADVVVQAPPNLSDDPGRLLDAGISDWGGVSPVTVDHVNPERPWPKLDRLRQVTESRGFALAPRLTAHPRYVLDPDRWLAPGLRTKVLVRSDAEGLGRDAEWMSGGDHLPPVLIPGPEDPALTGRSGPEDPALTGRSGPGRVQAGSAVAEVLAGVLLGQEPGEAELTMLFTARGPEVVAVAEVADDLRRRIVGDTVTWVSNRNINYTNVCTFKCRFCAFSKGPLSLNLRGSPYLLGLDEITSRVAEAVELGATEVCLQGGIHPSFDGDYYLEVIRAVRQASASIHIHGFTALEVTEGAKRNAEPLAHYLRRLMAAGLRTLPGTAAEILDDEVRRVLCADKVTTDEWLDAHRTAHSVGLRSNVTIMFGSIEHPRSWARHLIVTRDLQKETGGFTEFVPLPFVHMAAPIYLQGQARRGPTFREALLMHAVGRIAYAGHIDNIQVSWVKMGLVGARQLLRSGGNDLGGTLLNENISRAAGATHGQAMDEAGFRSVLDGLPGPRTLEQRTTLYGRVAQPA